MELGTLTGAGFISAVGGTNSSSDEQLNIRSYAGGGGRVAVYYTDVSGFTGRISAQGGSGRGTAEHNGGAGTVYWKRASEPLGELAIDNGGLETSGWSTPLLPQGILRLNSWTISGNARVSTTDGVRVANGNPAFFAGLLSSNYLQVGGLLVSNTWVYGDIMDLNVNRTNGALFLTVFGRPQKTYLLLASTNFLDWTPVLTNTPTGSRFDYPVPPVASSRQLFYRVAMLETLADSLALSLNPTNRRATLNLKNARPNHTLVLQASDDLRHWTALSTNTPVAITNWQFLDTNAPAFPRRFYRAIGQGK